MPKTKTALPDYITRLQDAIRKLHHCESKYVRSVTVAESFLSFAKKKFWRGEVAVFEVYGHPEAKRAYAWSDTVDDKDTRHVVVLEIPPVRCPATAVQAAIAAQIANGTFRSSSKVGEPTRSSSSTFER
jgi:hypothetical protein